MRAPQQKKGRQRDYTPISWTDYFDEKVSVTVSRGSFTVYTLGSAGPVVCLLHGGGYSALTWALCAKELCDLVQCRVVALDLRGHGLTRTSQDADLSLATLAEDVVAVLGEMFSCEEPRPGVVLVGHSMGGTVAAKAGEMGVDGLAGLVVVDVVEGTAMEALSSMHGFLRSRPQSFGSVSQAIEWCVRSGQVRNLESARVSMPGQIVNKETGQLAAAITAQQLEDTQQNQQATAAVSGKEQIKEEDETSELGLPSESSACSGIEAPPEPSGMEAPPAPSGMKAPPEPSGMKAPPAPSGMKAPTPPSGMGYTWRIDLAATEPHWSGWFTGMSARFLGVPTAKLLLLAGVDRLDRDLTVGQMQGKFQMQVLPQVGHAIHEDSPDKVAAVLASFLIRNKLATPSSSFTPTFPAC